MAAFRWLSTEFAATGTQAIADFAARARADRHRCSVVDGELHVQCGYNKEFFQALNVERHWIENSQALKWFRENAEFGEFGTGPLCFSNDSPMMMPVMKKHADGPDHRFDLFGPTGGRTVPWAWQSMVAQLDDPSIDCVVNGTSAVAASSGDQDDDQPHDPQQRTLTGCELVFQDVIDHKRHEVVKRTANVKWEGRDQMPQWDFMLKRNDGTVCCLHPNWSNNKVAFYEGIQDWIPNGIGSGRKQGAFKRAAMRVDRILKFDKSKTPSGVEPAVVPMDTPSVPQESLVPQESE